MDNNLNKYLNHVEGENRGHILVYALSKCAWCRRTKQLLKTMGVEYYYIDYDLVREEDRQKLMEAVEKWNPACVFPTVVIDGEYIRSDEIKIREVLRN